MRQWISAQLSLTLCLVLCGCFHGEGEPGREQTVDQPGYLLQPITEAVEAMTNMLWPLCGHISAAKGTAELGCPMERMCIKARALDIDNFATPWLEDNC